MTFGDVVIGRYRCRRCADGANGSSTRGDCHSSAVSIRPEPGQDQQQLDAISIAATAAAEPIVEVCSRIGHDTNDGRSMRLMSPT